MGTAIKIENLSKKYLISRQPRERYLSLRDAIARKAAEWGRRVMLRPAGERGGNEEFWALRNVSFEIEQGERLGIVGRNGAGKSTLLKIISRITDPTEGRVSINGRVASLLEIGTGFHPELTGRENIFLSGAILGMNRAEIRRKFDEIVDFAEVDKFLDTPVKRYSSGMYVRLAFAVAAHIEPEILVVDEVLAVGDARFQKKCLGKMEEVGRSGRTVLFVSHNMSAVKSLCNRGILLQSGELALEGEIDEVIKRYFAEMDSPRQADLSQRARDAKQTLRAKILEARIVNSQGQTVQSLSSHEPFRVMMKVESLSRVSCSFAAHVRDNAQRLIWMDSGTVHGQMFDLEPGISWLSCDVDSLQLAVGDYFVDAGISVPYHETIDWVPEACAFSVVECDPYGAGFNYSRLHGVFNPPHHWRLEPQEGS